MLAFADKERFHPLAIEAYLARCDLFRRRPRGRLPWRRGPEKVDADWLAAPGEKERFLGDRRARVLGGGDTSWFLQLLDLTARRDGRVRKPLWLGLGTMAAALAVGSRLAFRSSFSRVGLALLLAAAGVLLVLFFHWLKSRYSAERVGLILVVLAVIAALGMVVAAWGAQSAWLRWGSPALGMLFVAMALTAWARESLSPRAAAGLTRLAATPFVPGTVLFLASRWLSPGELSFVAAGLLLLFLLVLGDDIVAAFMVLCSPLRREASDRAARLEEELRAGSERGVYPYYGRVWRDRKGRSVVLQYFYFYAFNDWRRHGGLNFHEGDWESAMVLLEQRDDGYVAQKVAVGQHHESECRPWSAVKRAVSHPVLYVAAGSHAIYFDPAARRVQDLIRSPLLRALAAFRDKSQDAAAEGRRKAAFVRVRHQGRGLADVATTEEPNGKGLVIGSVAPADGAADAGWTQKVFSCEEPWSEYRGLWGRHSWLRNESGPTGPRWEREENLPRGDREVGSHRPTWDNPLLWFRDRPAQPAAVHRRSPAL